VAWSANLAAPKDRLATVVLLDGATVLGIAPLIIRRERSAGIPIKVPQLIGGVHSGYKGFLLQCEPARFTPRLFAALSSSELSWDVLVLDAIRADSPWPDLVRSECANHDLDCTIEVQTSVPYLELPASYEQLRGGLKKSLRRNLTRRMHQLERTQWAYTRHSGTALTEEHLREAARIERLSWKGQRGLGVFTQDRDFRFHADLLATPGKEFALDLAFLSINGAAAAFQYGFVEGSTYFAYNTSFDPKYREFSPGLLLMNALIEDLISNRMARCDLLQGGDAYKLDWTSQTRTNLRIVVFNRTVAGRLAHLTVAAKSVVKRSRAYAQLRRLRAQASALARWRAPHAKNDGVATSLDASE
jgi:CelD/BcsL family acetyltransferase involved in cellulose biosynthesis